MKSILRYTSLVTTITFTSLAIITSCANPDMNLDNDFIQATHIVSGKAEKGPMVSGSTAELRTLDTDMTATGMSFTSEIENHTGFFNFGPVKLNSQYAKLTAEGYFFNEVSGELSTSPIKLNAVIDLRDNSTVNVNIMTHLKSQRIYNLILKEKMSYKEANAKAQKELLKEFGLQQYGKTDASQISLSAGTEDSGVLIAISSLILGNRKEAEIVEFLSRLTNEFSTTGHFSEESHKQLRKTRNGTVNEYIEDIRQHIIDRYEELGYQTTVPNLDLFFDWNNDGIAGNEIESLPSDQLLEKSEIRVTPDGGYYTIKINSELPYYLESPIGEGDSTELGPTDQVDQENYYNSFYDTPYTKQAIDYSATIDKNQIHIQVNPGKFNGSKTAEIQLFDCRGRIATTITLIQEGKGISMDTMPKLGRDGEIAFNNILSQSSRMQELMLKLDKDFMHSNCNPLSPIDRNIETAWQLFYQSIQSLILIKDYDSKAWDCYQEIINVHLSMIYYIVFTHWSNIPYYMTKLDDYQLIRLPQTSEPEFYGQTLKLLDEALPILEEKANDSYSNVNSIFFVSKDVAKLLKAYIYMNQKEYENALPILEGIISSNHYQLIKSAPDNYEFNQESIFGYFSTDISKKETIAVLDYKDVILSAAECAFNTQQENKARQYLKMLKEAKGLPQTQNQFLSDLASTMRNTKSPNYRMFLRRNNLGSAETGLDEMYLIWPLPQRDVDLNTNLQQNPGY